MAKRPPNNGDEAPPRSYPQTPPPQDLYATSDIRFVMLEIGKFGAQIEMMRTDLAAQKNVTATLVTTVDRFRTGAMVAAVILAVAGSFGWWLIGEKLGEIRDQVMSPKHQMLSTEVPERQ